MLLYFITLYCKYETHVFKHICIFTHIPLLGVQMRLNKSLNP